MAKSLGACHRTSLCTVNIGCLQATRNSSETSVKSRGMEDFPSPQGQVPWLLSCREPKAPPTLNHKVSGLPSIEVGRNTCPQVCL